MLCSRLRMALNSVSPPINNSPHIQLCRVLGSATWPWKIRILHPTNSMETCWEKACQMLEESQNTLTVPALLPKGVPSYKQRALGLKYWYKICYWTCINAFIPSSSWLSSFSNGNEQQVDRVWMAVYLQIISEETVQMPWVIWLGFLLWPLLKHCEVCSAVRAGMHPWEGKAG